MYPWVNGRKIVLIYLAIANLQNTVPIIDFGSNLFPADSEVFRDLKTVETKLWKKNWKKNKK